MDGCDGAIARLTNTSTKFGGFFDSFMDRSSEFFIFFGLLIFNKDQVLWKCIDMKLIIFISFFASIMISYTRARVEVIFKGDFDIGLMARSERLFYLFLTMLISFFYGYMQLFLFIFMCLVTATLIFRITRIYDQIKKSENKRKI
jgi:archaetidylinositol phosphate synthase